MLNSRAMPSWVYTHVLSKNPAGNLDFRGFQRDSCSWVAKRSRVPSWRPYFMRLPAGFEQLLSFGQRGVVPRMSKTRWILGRN